LFILIINSSSLNSEGYTSKERENYNNKSLHKLNAEASIKNLKNNFTNKNINKIDHKNLDNIGENTIDKLEILKNYKEVSDIPEIRSLINTNKKDIAFPSGISISNYLKN